MSKRVKPNAEHRIVDGEIVSDHIDEKIQRAKAFSEQQAKTNQEESAAEPHEGMDPKKPISEGIEFSREADIQSKKPGIFVRFQGYFLWSLLFIIVILVLLITRPNNDWQIQKINDLQREVATLRQDSDEFAALLKSQEGLMQQNIKEQVNQALLKFDKNATASQADLSALQKALEDQIKQLQQGFVESAKSHVDSSSGLETKEEGATQLEAMSKLDEKYQTEINALKTQLTGLLDFKREQQGLDAMPPVLKLDMPLDSLQIQQWIVEVNTQWILNGRTAETRQQLLALEQAVSLSDFTYTTQLARLIGQDLGYLNQVEDAHAALAIPSTDDLKKRVSQLTASQTTAQKPDEADVMEHQQANALDALLDKFSQMITLKKRPQDNEMASVDTLLVNDVLQQRLLLLIDRLDWALKTQSDSSLIKAVNSIKAFIKQYYANEFSEFNALLEPFTNVEFQVNKPLSIMKLDEVIQTQ